uniref:Ras association domain family member 11 n=1 Tax=Hucho hucho TaxID=62062 RepID=A0A4W5MQ61_9TELE
MEVKVSVEGVPRVVCGITEKTTCQEVVIALAQSLGRPGRYTLQEKFKEFERNVTPSERLLESLEKYGQQAREIQLTLLHNGPSLWEGPTDAGGKTNLSVKTKHSIALVFSGDCEATNIGTDMHTHTYTWILSVDLLVVE